MKILRMQATFGRLERAELCLRPGLNVLELPNETASAVTGAQIDSTEGAKDIHFSSNDTAPYGCLGFYTTNIKADGSKYYKGFFYPKVKASLDGRTYNTKQKTIVLDSPKLTLSVDACNTGDYRIESDELTTEAAAKAWVNGKVKAAVGG